MKKSVYRFTLIFGFMVLLSSCMTYKMNFDKNVSPDQTATITFYNCLISKVNGVSVIKDLYGVDNTDNWINFHDVILTIQSGIHEIDFDVKCSNYIIRNIAIRYDFKAGKKYKVVSKGDYLDELPLRFEIFLNLYDVTTRLVELLREWKIGEF